MKIQKYCCVYGIVLLGILSACSSQNTNPGGFNTGKLIYSDDFENSLDNWVVETKLSDSSRVGIIDGQLEIDVNGGCTVWLQKKLSGNIYIEYDRTVVMAGGMNDRLSDLNQFWMATDPANEKLFTRSGVFAEYDPLVLYYAGVGGNYNKTTRFRKYVGTGDRVLMQEKNDEKHLLKPNHTYFVQITVKDGNTRIYLDGEQYFSFDDEEPLTEGYFGFRTVWSRQQIDNFKVYELN